MAPEYGGSAGPDASTVPLADGGTENAFERDLFHFESPLCIFKVVKKGTYT